MALVRRLFGLHSVTFNNLTREGRGALLVRARAARRITVPLAMSVASEYKQLLSVSGSPQITLVLLLILQAASC